MVTSVAALFADPKKDSEKRLARRAGRSAAMICSRKNYLIPYCLSTLQVNECNGTVINFNARMKSTPATPTCAVNTIDGNGLTERMDRGSSLQSSTESKTFQENENAFHA
ncbi:MAG: hypothetical protein ABIL58_21985 [Pseudomonadota bacterium]